jgi:lysophospholipase L1-like esterase
VEVIRSFTGEKQGFVPQILLLSPPEIGEGIAESPFYGRFREDAITRSREFAKYYKRVADEQQCLFFDTASCIKPSEIDSLHLSEEAHAALAEKLFQIITQNTVEIKE